MCSNDGPVANRKLADGACVCINYYVVPNHWVGSLYAVFSVTSQGHVLKYRNIVSHDTAVSNYQADRVGQM